YRPRCGRHPHRRSALAGRGDRRGDAPSRRRALPADPPQFACRSERGRLSLPCHGGAEDAARETAESSHGPAGPPIAGAHMSAKAPLQRIPVGVVVERGKATSPWIDWVWLPIAVLGGLPETAAWTVLAREGETTRFYAGAAEIELYRS